MVPMYMATLTLDAPTTCRIFCIAWNQHLRGVLVQVLLRHLGDRILRWAPHCQTMQATLVLGTMTCFDRVSFPVVSCQVPFLEVGHLCP